MTDDLVIEIPRGPYKTIHRIPCWATIAPCPWPIVLRGSKQLHHTSSGAKIRLHILIF